jgi:multidrug resistance efflux pump
VVGAKATLDAAFARRTELTTARPALGLPEAAARVAVLRALVGGEEAPDPESLTLSGLTSELPDLGALAKSVAQDESQIAVLETALGASRIVAPFSGTVTAVSVQPGSLVEAAQPVISVIRRDAQADIVVRADLDAKQAAVVAVGQRADLQTKDGAPPLIAAVADLTQSGKRSVAVLKIEGPTTPFPYGLPVRIALTTRSKEDALLIPEQVVRTAGAKSFADVLTERGRQSVEVQLGIVAAGQAEVLSGLSEGQKVVLP